MPADTAYRATINEAMQVVSVIHCSMGILARSSRYLLAMKTRWVSITRPPDRRHAKAQYNLAMRRGHDIARNTAGKRSSGYGGVALVSASR